MQTKCLDEQILIKIENLDTNKISMYSKLKLLIRLKNFLSKNCYHKNFPFVINKEWLDIFKKLIYLQIQTMRKYSLSDGEQKFQRQDLKKYNRTNDKTIQEISTTILLNKKNLSLPKQEKSVNIYNFVLYIKSFIY
jgi:hypothetical protein